MKPFDQAAYDGDVFDAEAADNFVTPLGNYVNFPFTGIAYTAPSGDQVNFGFVYGNLAAAVDIEGTGAGTYVISGSAAGEISDNVILGTGVGTYTPAGTATGEVVSITAEKLAGYTYVVAITVCIDAIGATETHYFTDGRGFCTKPTDSPANVWVQPRLLNPGNIRREMFSGNRTFGPVRPAFGEISIANADGALDAWMDYAIDGRQVSIYWGDPDAKFLDQYHLVYRCIGSSLIADFDVLRVRLKDRLYLLDKPILNQTFAGTGGLEGPADMAGRVKPRVFQDPGYIPVVQVDAQKLVYFVACETPGPYTTWPRMYDGGVELTREADYTTAAEVLSTAPSAGMCRFYFSNEGTWIRLGSPPAMELRCWTHGYQDNGSVWLSSELAEEAGIATTSIVIYNSIPYRYIDDASATYANVIDSACEMQFVWYGMSREDKWVGGMLNHLDTASKFTFDTHNSWGFKRNPPQDRESPAYKLTCNSGQVWPCETAGGATAELKDYLSRKNWWSSWSHEDVSVLDRHPGAPTVVIENPNRQISNSSAWEYFYTNWFSVYGEERDLITLTCKLDTRTLYLEIGEAVTVQIPRFGLDAGKLFTIVSQTLDLSRNEITFGLWG